MKNINNDTALPYEDLLGRLRYVCDWIPAAETNGKSVLNVGCGYGWFEKYLVEHRQPTRVVGIEQSEEDLATARRALSGTPVEFDVADGVNLPLPDVSFDVCLSTEVLEHIPKQTEVAFFSEISRVLKPGGRFYMTTPSGHARSRFTDPAYYLVGHRHYSVAQIEGYAARSGFELISHDVIGGYASLAGIWDMYISKWIFRREPMLRDWLQDRIEQEYQRRDGFLGLFCVLQKLG